MFNNRISARSRREVWRIKHRVNPTGDARAIERMCADNGLRMTEQRRIFARVLSTSHDHPDVEELHRRAREIDSRISLATIYRTARLFCRMGIIGKHNFGVGRVRLKLASDRHHDYLIDSHSGKVIEFRSDEIQCLLTQIASQLGYRIVERRLELYAVPIDGIDQGPPRRHCG